MDMHAARALALDLVRAGIEAADPHDRVVEALRRDPIHRNSDGRLVLLALGKAAVRMTEGALEVLGPPDRGVVVTTDGHARDLPGVDVHAAGHPLPDARGLAAGLALERAVEDLTPDDQVLVLISGGGSALVPAPVDGVSLADLIALNGLLLGAGLPIHDVNRVRQAVSRLKGGGLARRCAPAAIRTLALSDVFDDDPRVIASGPTVPPIGTPSKAARLLRDHGLWDDLPASICAALSREDAVPDTPAAPFTLIGSNLISVHAMADRAAGSSFEAQVAEDPITGDVDAVARHLVARLTSLEAGEAWLAGGETTVHLQGRGLGGRNQELALRVAWHAHHHPVHGRWVFAAAGSDGRDGPTDAAGGLVDGGTLSRLRAAGGDPASLLADNDSHRALSLSGDRLVTGPTGTNVADLFVLLRV